MRFAKTLFFGLLAVLLFSSGCLGSPGFGAYWNDFSRILTRNGGDNSHLVPVTQEQLNSLEIELSAYQASVEKQGSSSGQQAILKLMEAERNMIHMQQNILSGQQQSRLANLAFPNCKPESNLGKAIGFFESANTQAILANQNLEAFVSDFPGQSQETGIDFENLKLSLTTSKEGISQSKAALENYCP